MRSHLVVFDRRLRMPPRFQRIRMRGHLRVSIVIASTVRVRESGNHAGATEPAIPRWRWNNRRVQFLRVPLAILRQNAQVVDDMPMHIVVMHKLRSICINDGHQRPVQLNRRIVECMVLAGQRIVFTIMCPRRARLS